MRVPGWMNFLLTDILKSLLSKQQTCFSFHESRKYIRASQSFCCVWVTGKPRYWFPQLLGWLPVLGWLLLALSSLMHFARYAMQKWKHLWYTGIQGGKLTLYKWKCESFRWNLYMYSPPKTLISKFLWWQTYFNIILLWKLKSKTVIRLK